MKINYKHIFIYSDQPTTCPKCGARTEIVLDLAHTKNQTQVHECLANECSFMFVIQHDEDFAES